MQMALFLIWSFGFWLVIGLTEYLFVKGLGSDVFFFGNDILSSLLLSIVWIVGMVHTYRDYRITVGVRYTDDDEKGEAEANTHLIVEAPNHSQAQAMGSEYVESEVYLQWLPAKGKRFVLTAENNDDSNILATVEEAAEVLHRFKDGKKYRVWVRLDNPDDYSELYNRIGWSPGLGEKRPSISEPIGIPALQEPV